MGADCLPMSWAAGHYYSANLVRNGSRGSNLNSLFSPISLAPTTIVSSLKQNLLNFKTCRDTFIPATYAGFRRTGIIYNRYVRRSRELSTLNAQLLKQHPQNPLDERTHEPRRVELLVVAHTKRHLSPPCPDVKQWLSCQNYSP